MWPRDRRKYVCLMVEASMFSSCSANRAAWENNNSFQAFFLYRFIRVNTLDHDYILYFRIIKVSTLPLYTDFPSQLQSKALSLQPAPPNTRQHTQASTVCTPSGCTDEPGDRQCEVS